MYNINYIYYNIYNSKKALFAYLHLLNVTMSRSHIVTAGVNGLSTGCPLATKSNLRGSKITDSRPRNYGSLNFSKFVLKIGSNRWAKFGGTG